VYTRIHFKNGNLETKREILKTTGTKFVLRDKILYLSPKKVAGTNRKRVSKIRGRFQATGIVKKVATSTQKQAFRLA
jgi:hypothetical protein